MREFLIGIACLLTIGCHQIPTTVKALATPEAEPTDAHFTTPTSWIIKSIDWDDADSGDINDIRFRLYNIDAPETGGVGAAVGPAKCALERERGLKAKAWMIEQTPPSALRITATHGYDNTPKPRLLIELAVNGQDIGKMGIAAGYLKPWPHRGSKPLAPKPDWCKPE